MITLEEIRSNAPMRALSWKQPYLALMMHGKIETRTWSTNYRGLVLMCASKQAYGTDSIINISGLNQYKRIFALIHEQKGHSFFYNGAAIAIGKLVDCRTMLHEDQNKCFVEFWDGLYCHFYEDVTPIKPFPWKGTQGWSTVPADIRNKIELLP